MAELVDASLSQEQPEGSDKPQRRKGSSPFLTTIARMVKLVDTPDLGSGDFGHESSSLSSGTK